MTNELIKIETLQAKEVFASKNATLEAVIEQILNEVADFKGDTSTPQGRKEIASMAFKVTKYKTALDTLGKDHVGILKKHTKSIDDQRRSMRMRLEDKAAEIRQPLTNYEEQEAQKEADIKRRIEDIDALAAYHITGTADLKANIETAKAIDVDESFGDFTRLAEEAKQRVLADLEARLETAIKRDEDAADLARLRKEADERDQREAKAEALRAEEKAEEDEKRRIDDEERRKKEEAKNAELEAAHQEAAEKQKKLDDIKAEEARKKREAEIRKEEAARAEAGKAKAVQDEKDRADRVRREEEEAAKKREANKKHHKKINNAALAGFIAVGLEGTAAKMAVEAVALGKIANISIKY